MARLPNAKHEEFAQLVAGGMPQGEAYAQLYKPSAPHASHLRKRPEVAARVNELMNKALSPVLAEDQTDLADVLGGDPILWCQRQYMLINEKARGSFDFKTANAAVNGVQSLLTFETKRMEATKDKVPSKGPMIDVNSLSQILDRVANVIAESKGNAVPDRPTMRALDAAENDV